MKRVLLAACLVLIWLLPALAQEPDLLEPNDRAEQSVSIDLLTPYYISFYPDGDYDYFSFRLDKQMLVEPQWKEATGNVYCVIENARGNLIANRFPALLSPGNYYFKLSGSTSPEPFVFSVKAYPFVSAVLPPVLETDRAYSMSLHSPDEVDSFRIRAGGSGYVVLQALQAPAYGVTFSATLNGKEWRGNPLVIPVSSTGIITARLMAGSEFTTAPFLLYASKSKLLDQNEPNDSIPISHGVDKSKPVYFSLFPSGDEDWFRISVTGAGKIMADLSYAFTSGNNAGFPYALELYDGQKKKVCDFSYRSTLFGKIYSSCLLQKPGTYYLRVYSGMEFTGEQMLALQLYGNLSGSQGGKNLADIYFVGFELDSSARASLLALSESQGANFVTVDSAGSIEQTLTEIFADARKPRKRSSILGWVLGLLAAAGAGYAAYRWRFRSKPKTSA